MGLLGSYVVRLRCDAEKHVGPRLWKEFYADNMPHAVKLARQLGWKYDHRTDTASCPKCVLRRTIRVMKGRT